MYKARLNCTTYYFHETQCELKLKTSWRRHEFKSNWQLMESFLNLKQRKEHVSKYPYFGKDFTVMWTAGKHQDFGWLLKAHFHKCTRTPSHVLCYDTSFKLAYQSIASSHWRGIHKCQRELTGVKGKEKKWCYSSDSESIYDMNQF